MQPCSVLSAGPWLRSRYHSGTEESKQRLRGLQSLKHLLSGLLQKKTCQFLLDDVIFPSLKQAY